jgi:stage II sporulation protein D
MEIEDLDKEKIEENLRARYNINAGFVLTLVKDEYVSQPIKNVGDITDLYCEKRLAGGVMDELVIVTTGNTFKVIAENTIRYVLNDGVSKVVRQDGSEVESPNLLPSAFMIIEPVKQKGIVTGYKLSGGGYGHGVGMSQNGARALGLTGADCGEILDCFYEACEVRTVY